MQFLRDKRHNGLNCSEAMSVVRIDDVGKCFDFFRLEETIFQSASMVSGNCNGKRC